MAGNANPNAQRLTAPINPTSGKKFGTATATITESVF